MYVSLGAAQCLVQPRPIVVLEIIGDRVFTKALEQTPSELNPLGLGKLEQLRQGLVGNGHT